MSKYSNVFSDESLETHVDNYHDAVSSMGKKFPMYLSLKNGQEALVRFLAKDPLKFWQHKVFDPEARKGAGSPRVFTCTRTPDCPLCAAGDKPSFKVAWQVVHIDHLDKDGKVAPRVKLWVQGIRFGEMWVTRTKRVDPTAVNVVIIRTGAAQNTSYAVDPTMEGGKITFDQDEVVDLREYFGIDDERYNDMVRLGDSVKASVRAQKAANASGSSKPAHQYADADEDDGAEEPYSGPVKGARSPLEDDGEAVPGNLNF